MGKSQELYKRARKIIPGGTQLFSKRPEMFLPEYWPAYYKKAEGCYVWDLDGKKYVDMSYMGVGACILGYSDKDVNEAVKKAVNQGSISTLNCPEEVDLAKRLCQIHPWADMARFAKTGGEAASIAIRIARTKTRKSKVLFCGYHGWHDWYLSANLRNDKELSDHLLSGLSASGIPKNLEGTAVPFHYNDLKGFLDLIHQHKEDIACVVMEPIRNFYPQKGFLEKIREVTKEFGIVLIFDEVSSGWRLAAGGAHLKFKVNPDLAIFGKGMSNGYAMAAIIGRGKVMQAAQDTFISSTYWTERIGLVASLVTINKIKKHNIPRHLDRIGRQIQTGWRQSAQKHKLDISIQGIPPMGHFQFNDKNSLILKTLFTQLMLEKGFLATTAFYASYAHKERHVEGYLKAVDDVFHALAKIILKGNPKHFLKGPVCHSGFQRLN